MLYTENDPQYEQRVKEWNEIEELVLIYQKQFVDIKYKKESDKASILLIERFKPLLKKYISVITSGQINWNDKESRLFVYNFISDPELQKALKRTRQRQKYRIDIIRNFNFIKETYGSLKKEEIMLDLEMLLLVLAKRYKQAGRNFCGYVYNAYRYEVCRFIKLYIKDPINIGYKKNEYEDTLNGISNERELEESYEDNYYELLTDLPSNEWFDGDCSEIFADLDNLDRHIIVKYYLEEWKDKQIADFLGIHINTVNQRRRNATKKIAKRLGYLASAVRRTRKSGKRVLI